MRYINLCVYIFYAYVLCLIVDEKKILSTWANVSAKDISGVRAPYLQQGGDNQFTAMTKASLKYDASQLTQTFSDKNHLLWPYTYDFDSIQDCVLPPCPTHSFPGNIFAHVKAIHHYYI